MSGGALKNHGLTVDDADRLLDTIVEFSDHALAFERIQPITDFRKDDSEARILYICRRIRRDETGVNGEENPKELYILKCKVQAPSVLAGGLTEPISGPSDHTKDELKALQTFTDTKSTSLPHLVAWKTERQRDDGPMPGGYIAYIVMTLMPGQHLMDLKFWSMSDDEKEKIRKAFVPVLKKIWRLGFEPYDTALRNILWEPETQKLSIIDFEHWHPATVDPINMDEMEEMQRWGIQYRPPLSAGTAWKEWFRLEGLGHQRGSLR